LLETETKLGLVLGGEAGSRLAEHLGITVSGDTLLRRIDCLASKPVPSLHVVGVDDWALRKGQRYGTLICDLERKCPVAILPTRSAEVLARWLMLHPEIEVVSRDRGGEYAKGTACGAPQATQVADRWHLLCNASQALMKTVERNISKVNECLKDVNSDAPVTPQQDDSEMAVQSSIANDSPVRVACRPIPITRAQLRYEQVVALKQQGKGIREIARSTGMSRGTVRRFYQADTFPKRVFQQRTSYIFTYREAIADLWRQGLQTARAIHEELRNRGFKGSYYMVARHLRRCKSELEIKTPKSVRRNQVVSPRSVVWLLTRRVDDLSAEEIEKVKQIETGCCEIRRASEIVRDFSDMIRNRDRAKWECWLENATAPTAPRAIRSFASNLKKDAAAIKAALELPWSNGQLEGQINKLKMLKRQMYGRANLKLLEHRLLCVA
jgi:transposase